MHVTCLYMHEKLKLATTETVACRTTYRGTQPDKWQFSILQSWTGKVKSTNKCMMDTFKLECLGKEISWYINALKYPTEGLECKANDHSI